MRRRRCRRAVPGSGRSRRRKRPRGRRRRSAKRASAPAPFHVPLRTRVNERHAEFVCVRAYEMHGMLVRCAESAVVWRQPDRAARSTTPAAIPTRGARRPIHQESCDDARCRTQQREVRPRRNGSSCRVVDESVADPLLFRPAHAVEHVKDWIASVARRVVRWEIDRLGHRASEREAAESKGAHVRCGVGGVLTG